MPVHRGKDSSGPYYQWGNHGKKYYYTANNVKTRENAKNSATKQGQAAHAHGWQGR